MSQAYNEWTSVEMDLYLKGAKLFGRNRYKIVKQRNAINIRII